MCSIDFHIVFVSRGGDVAGTRAEARTQLIQIVPLHWSHVAVICGHETGRFIVTTHTRRRADQQLSVRVGQILKNYCVIELVKP